MSHVISNVIPVQEPFFVLTAGATFAEYCDSLPSEQSLALRRLLTGVRIDPETQLYLSGYPVWVNCFVVVEDQTPDTAMIAPILARLADCCPRMELRYFSADGDLAALNELVDDELDLEEDLDDLDLPLLLFFDDEWNQVGQWGPRPEAAEDRLDAWLAGHPNYAALMDSDDEEDSPELDMLVEELTHQMRLWYNDDLTGACVEEIRAVLQSLESDE